MAASPSTTTSATAIGKTEPPWKRTFLPLPREASLATFLADDDGATRMRGYRLPESKLGHASLGSTRRSGPRTPGQRRQVRPLARPIAARRPPSAAGASGRRQAAATRRGTQPRSSGGTHTPAARLGEDPRHLGARIDRRQHRAAGRQDRVRLRRDADATEARLQRDEMDVAGRQHLRQSIDGLIAGEAHVGQAIGRLRSSDVACRAVAVDEERQRSASLCAAAMTISSDCEKPTLPAYSTTVSSPMPSSRAQRRHAVERPDEVGVDEVGDHPDVVAASTGAPWRRRCRAGRC